MEEVVIMESDLVQMPEKRGRIAQVLEPVA